MSTTCNQSYWMMVGWKPGTLTQALESQRSSTKEVKLIAVLLRGAFLPNAVYKYGESDSLLAEHRAHTLADNQFRLKWYALAIAFSSPRCATRMPQKPPAI